MKRFERLSDYIEIKCKKCGSLNVELRATSMDDDSYISYDTHCNNCGVKFDDYFVKEIEVLDENI